MNRRRVGLLVIAICAVPAALSCSTDITIEDGWSGNATGTGGAKAASSTSAISVASAVSTGVGGAPGNAGEMVLGACPDLASSAHYCLTIAHSNVLYAFDPAVGEVCKVGELSNNVATFISSSAIVGGAIVGCDSALWRASVLGGAVEVPGIPCDAVTDYQGGFLLRTDAQDLVHYSTFADILVANGAEKFTPSTAFSRIATNENMLFTAWHSTDTVDVYDLALGTPGTPLLLEGFDDWIDGMADTDGRLYILSSGNHLWAFDDKTGAKLQEVPIVNPDSQLLLTLHCWTQ